MAASKQLLRAAQGRTEDEFFEIHAPITRRTSEDAKEGPLSFAEKRPPPWTGH